MRILTDEELLQAIDQPALRAVGQASDALGLECYVIGGWVRDLYLQRPSKDIDIVAVGHGQERPGILLAKAVAEAWSKRTGRKPHIALYARFGTAQIRLEGMELEFVGARRESYARDSRKPIVEDGTLEDDQRRRDFTINALAIGLSGAQRGQLLDPFEGLLDLQDGILATPLDPDTTFSDDPLRMLRCIRFATQLNFQIEPDTADALRRNAPRIEIISAERVAEELNKIMSAAHPSKGIYELMDSGLLALVMPEVADLAGVQQVNGRGHKDNFFHTLEVVENVVSMGGGLWLRWAALLHDIGKPRCKRWDAKAGWTFHNHEVVGGKMVETLFRRLKLPLDERMKFVQKMVTLHMRPIAIADDEVTDSAVRRLLFEAGDDIDDLMLLCHADITSRNEAKKRRFHENFRIVKEKLVAIEEKDRIRNMKLPVNGEEIMQRFELPPSKPVGLLKDAMKEAILDGIIPNEHDPALAFIDNYAAQLGLRPTSAQGQH